MGTPSLPLSNIINVAVNVSPTAAPGPSFNQLMVCGPSTVISSTQRVRLYTNTAAMQTDGFSTNSPELLAAELYFGQTPAPTFLQVGRQNLTAIQMATLGATAGTGYVVGDIVTAVQSGATAGQLSVTTVGMGGAVTALAPIQGSQGNGYSIATNLTTTGGTGTGLEVDITAIGETPLQAMAACRLASTQWYIGMFVGTAVDADHLAIAEYIQGASPNSQYFLTTSEAAVLNNTTPNILATLQAAKLRRTLSVYSTTQSGTFPDNVYASAAAAGYAMGANTGAAGSYFNLDFKTMAGVGYEPLSQTQMNNICGPIDRSSTGLNGNVVLNYANGDYTFLQPGIMADGSWFDTVLNLDILASNIQFAAMNLLISLPSVPLTDAGVLLMKSTIAGACNQAVNLGFIATTGVWNGPNVGTGNSGVVTGQSFPQGYYIYVPPVSTLTAGQRAARIMPPFNVLIIEAGTAQSLGVTITVQQ